MQLREAAEPSGRREGNLSVSSDCPPWLLYHCCFLLTFALSPAPVAALNGGLPHVLSAHHAWLHSSVPRSLVPDSREI